MNETTTTLTTTASGTDLTNIALGGSIDYFQPVNCYPYYQPWGGWYPYYPPVPTYISPPQYVTQQIIIPQRLTEDEIDAIADRVAKKLLAAKKGKA